MRIGGGNVGRFFGEGDGRVFQVPKKKFFCSFEDFLDFFSRLHSLTGSSNDASSPPSNRTFRFFGEKGEGGQPLSFFFRARKMCSRIFREGGKKSVKSCFWGGKNGVFWVPGWEIWKGEEKRGGREIAEGGIIDLSRSRARNGRRGE